MPNPDGRILVCYASLYVEEHQWDEQRANQIYEKVYAYAYERGAYLFGPDGLEVEVYIEPGSFEGTVKFFKKALDFIKEVGSIYGGFVAVGGLSVWLAHGTLIEISHAAGIDPHLPQQVEVQGGFLTQIGASLIRLDYILDHWKVTPEAVFSAELASIEADIRFAIDYLPLPADWKKVTDAYLERSSAWLHKRDANPEKGHHYAEAKPKIERVRQFEHHVKSLREQDGTKHP